MSAESTTNVAASMQFSYNGLCVRVESPSQADLLWLEEFFSPQFERSDDSPYSWRVVLSHDCTRYDEVLARGPRPDGALVDSFALDASIIQLPAWTSDDGIVTAFEERYPVFYSVDSRNRVVTVVACQDRPVFRIPVMRVVRELAMNHTLRTGGLFLHASASTFGGRGVVVTGPKSAGKTTMLVYLLSNGARCVANDRVLATPDGDGFRLRGMPTIVAIRPGTFEFFHDFRDRLRDSPYYAIRTIAESLANTSSGRRTVDDDKIGISPAQFLDLLDARAAPGCEAGAVIFPHVTGDVATFDLVPLGASDAARRFGPSLLGVHPWKKQADIFSAPDDPEPLDAASIDALCTLIAERVPCFECHLGPEAYRDDALAKAIADSLGARA